MRGTRSNEAAYAAIAVAAALLALSACSTIDQVRSKDGASSEKEARDVASNDPLARPIQVAWTSARATHCGFIFDPDQLRSNYLAAEIQSGIPQEEMKKIARAYDYTRESTLASIKDNLGLLQQGAHRRHPQRPQPLSGRGLRALGADGPLRLGLGAGCRRRRAIGRRGGGLRLRHSDCVGELQQRRCRFLASEEIR